MSGSIDTYMRGEKDVVSESYFILIKDSQTGICIKMFSEKMRSPWSKYTGGVSTRLSGAAPKTVLNSPERNCLSRIPIH